MIILKESIEPTHRHFVKSADNFTQVRITAIMKDFLGENVERPVAQFFGMTAQIHANQFLEKMKWNDVLVDLTA